MPRYTQNDAEALVFTFKDGLLSKVAHDLKVRVSRFSLDFDPAASKISADFDPSSLEVINAVHDGVEDPKALSAADKDKIASQIQKEVLETGSHPKIQFTSTKVARRPDGGYSITGDLTLHGTTRPISAWCPAGTGTCTCTAGTTDAGPRAHHRPRTPHQPGARRHRRR